MTSSADSFMDGPAPPYNDALVSAIRKRAPYAFLVCFRNKNKNVVVYELCVRDGRVQDPPIRGYWLVLEPSYMDERRKLGIAHDREDFSFLDTQFAWGFGQRRVSDTEAIFTFDNHASLPITVRLNESRSEANAFGAFRGRKYLMRSMYVEASENIKLMNIADNLKKLTISGTDITSKPYRSVNVILKGG